MTCHKLVEKKSNPTLFYPGRHLEKNWWLTSGFSPKISFKPYKFHLKNKHATETSSPKSHKTLRKASSGYCSVITFIMMVLTSNHQKHIFWYLLCWTPLYWSVWLYASKEVCFVICFHELRCENMFDLMSSKSPASPPAELSTFIWCFCLHAIKKS